MNSEADQLVEANKAFIQEQCRQFNDAPTESPYQHLVDPFINDFMSGKMKASYSISGLPRNLKINLPNGYQLTTTVGLCNTRWIWIGKGLSYVVTAIKENNNE